MKTGSLGFAGLAVVTLLMLGACARAVLTSPPIPFKVGAAVEGPELDRVHPAR